MGLGLGIGVGLSVVLDIGEGVPVALGIAAAGANKQPESIAANNGSARIGFVGRARRRDLTNPSTRECAETCTSA
jgi:hypothetical protein